MHTRHIGYVRVSTDDQHCENQILELVKAGVDRKHIYQDTASGGQWDRPQLHKALDYLREGDTLVVWKLDRLSRSLSDLLMLMERIKKTGAGFKSLTEAIDTTTACGELIMHVLGAFAEFERTLIRERTKVGLKRAREKGRIGGGQFIMTAAQEAHALAQIAAGKSQTEVAKDQRVSKATICRLVARANKDAAGLDKRSKGSR
jgi:DNA invertase Pin-like site-specific DNA recombinase